MSNRDKLTRWLDGKIEKAQERGDAMFMGIPDSWYEPPRFCCENGHISQRYLKSEEKGDLCLACAKSVFIFPSDATQDTLNEVLL